MYENGYNTIQNFDGLLLSGDGWYGYGRRVVGAYYVASGSCGVIVRDGNKKREISDHIDWKKRYEILLSRMKEVVEAER